MSKLNNYFDSLSPDEETKNKMLGNILKRAEEPKKKNNVIYFKKIAPYAAAVIAFAVIIGSGSEIKKHIAFDETPDNLPIEKKVTQQVKKNDEEKNKTVKSDQDGEKSLANTQKKQENSTYGQDSKKTGVSEENASAPNTGDIKENSAESKKAEAFSDSLIEEDKKETQTDKVSAYSSGGNANRSAVNGVSLENAEKYSFCIPKSFSDKENFIGGTECDGRVMMSFAKDETYLDISLVPQNEYDGEYDLKESLSDEDSFTIPLNGYAVSYYVYGDISAKEIISEIN